MNELVLKNEKKAKTLSIIALIGVLFSAILLASVVISYGFRSILPSLNRSLVDNIFQVARIFFILALILTTIFNFISSKNPIKVGIILVYVFYFIKIFMFFAHDLEYSTPYINFKYFLRYPYPFIEILLVTIFTVLAIRFVSDGIKRRKLLIYFTGGIALIILGYKFWVLFRPIYFYYVNKYSFDFWFFYELYFIHIIELFTVSLFIYIYDYKRKNKLFRSSAAKSKDG